MAFMYETEEKQEKVILVAVDLDDGSDVDDSLDELEELAQTAGAVSLGRVVQKRDAIHPGTYVGKGKIQELQDMLWETGADAIVCDDELSPAQITNLQEELDTYKKQPNSYWEERAIVLSRENEELKRKLAELEK